jgi:hypothetical protein
MQHVVQKKYASSNEDAAWKPLAMEKHFFLIKKL